MKKFLTFGWIVTGALIFGSLVYAGGPTNPIALSHIEEHHTQVCVSGGADTARCHAHVVTDGNGSPAAALTPAGYGPQDFHGAYIAAVNAPSSQIIAIVDAYDHPNILSDLNTYSATFGIPSLPACVGPVASSAVPCFKKVNQNGVTSPLPQVNAGWALEIALDVEAAHAMCQNCSILLVEANSNSYTNLFTAFDRAIALGATVVSNSYGSNEFSGETSYDFHFDHPGIAMTFSAGDSGYGAEYPAASPFVTSVGGTTLFVNATDHSYGSESVWSGTGSGCSAYEGKPTWQFDTLCTHRTLNDISAVANPSTGAAVYDSVRLQGKAGWFKVGGTSLSSPLVAGMYALAGGVPTGTVGNSLPYTLGNGTNLHDVVSGTNGSCGGTYFCTAILGYDAPTGLGTPNGLGAL